MPLSRVRVPQKAWFGDTELELVFPSSWDVVYLGMSVEARPRLSHGAILQAFLQPIGMPPLSELAQGKRSAVIVFDDLTRPTRAYELVPYILEQLHLGGVPEEGIRFLAALGSHGAMNREEFAKKLGEEVLERFPVYNHNAYENCTMLGTTSFGTPVSINSEFMSCDLKIGVGCILPHWTRGFGGGGKLLMPGLAHIDTIEANHGGLIKSGALKDGTLRTTLAPSVGWGRYDDNIMRFDIEEAVRMAGFNMIVNSIVNLRRETTDLFVGDPIDAHVAGVKVAKEVYPTSKVPDADIVVANTFSKANESVIALKVASQLLEKSSGDVVLIINAPDGQVTHYLRRGFGKTVGGRLWSPITKLPQGVRRLLVVSDYPDLAGWEMFAPVNQIIWKRNWREALDDLEANYGGRARVAILPDATIQYFNS
jgi:nickel-dependent lactate racemase